MESLRELFITLGLDVDAAGFAQAQVAVTALEKAAGLLVGALEAIGETLVESVTQTAAYSDRISDASIRTGASTESLQELGYAAKLSGSSLETVETVLTKLSAEMDKARNGSADASGAFRKLGVSVTGADGKLRGSDEVFREASEALSKMGNQSERNALALNIFGKAGKELLPLISEGAKGIAAMSAEARDLGLILDSETIKRNAEFNDSLDTVHATLTGFKNLLGSVLIETLGPYVKSMTEWVKANRDVIQSGIIKFGKILTTVLTKVAAAAEFVADNFKIITLVAGAVAAIVGGSMVASFVAALAAEVAWAVGAAGGLAAVALEAGLTAAALGFMALEAIVAAAPFILLGVAIAGVILFLEDLWVYAEGGNSIIGKFGENWVRLVEAWTQDTQGDNPFVRAIKDVIWLLSDITERVPKAVRTLNDAIGGFFTDTIPLAIKEFIQALPGLLAPITDLFKAIVPSFVVDALGGGASPTASANAAAGTTNNQASNSVRNNITVIGSPGQSPNEVGQAAFNASREGWSDMLQPVTYGVQR